MVVWGKVLLTLLAGGCCGWLMLKKKVMYLLSMN